MKSILGILVLLVSTQVMAIQFPSLSNEDFEATVEYSNKVAVETAQDFAASKGYTSVEVVALPMGALDMSAKYLAQAGSCKFTVKVGLFFKAKVSNVKNCDNNL